MLLLLDNYDSFTYNLYQYLAEQGAEIEVSRNDQITLDDVEHSQTISSSHLVPAHQTKLVSHVPLSRPLVLVFPF